MSISRKSTPRIYQSYTTVAHRLNKGGYKSLWNSIPLLYNGISKLLHVYGWVWSGINLSLKFIPKMFNWGHVWWHWSPIQTSDIVVWNKLLCDSSCMWLLQNSVSFGKIVLHEYVSCMKGTTILANTLFTNTLAFTLRLKTTRRFLLCRVIPSHTCIDPTVTSYIWLDVSAAVRINPVPYMIHHHLLDLTRSGDTRTWLSWHQNAFYVPCLVDALFQARYCRSTAAKRWCNVLFGSNHHEHPKCSVSFIVWEPWHDRTETYSTST